MAWYLLAEKREELSGLICKINRLKRQKMFVDKKDTTILRGYDNHIATLKSIKSLLEIEVDRLKEEVLGEN